MTFNIGDKVQCVDGQAWGSDELETHKVYTVSDVHHAGEHIRVNGREKWWYRVRFVPVIGLGISQETDLPEVSPAPPLKPMLPTVVLNPKAKREKVYQPSTTENFYHVTFKNNPHKFLETPFWLSIKHKLPNKHREKILYKLLEIFSSPVTKDVAPHKEGINLAFLWTSTPQGHSYWNCVRHAINSGDWTTYDNTYT